MRRAYRHFRRDSCGAGTRLSGEKAAARLTGIVEQHDLPVVRGAYGLNTAFASEFGPQGAPCIATFAEYDALWESATHAAIIRSPHQAWARRSTSPFIINRTVKK